MNLAKLFKMQKELDARIEQEHPREPGDDRLAKKILALLVELGELANELPEVFKFWSNRKNNYQKALEEYCDGLHFILSIGNDLNLSEIEFQFNENEFTSTLEAFRHTINWAVNLDYVLFDADTLFKPRKTYFWLLNSFVWLGEQLGFAWEQIEQAYIRKNQINHDRQNNSY